MIIEKDIQYTNDYGWVVSQRFGVEIPAIYAEEAPIAIIVYRPGHDPKEYRWYNNKLYTEAHCETPDKLVQYIDINKSFHCTEKEAREALCSAAAQYIIIGGFVWEEAMEPYYRIKCLKTSGVRLKVQMHSWERPQKIDHNAFSALEEDFARSTAIKMANEGGRTDCIHALKDRSLRIEVILPDAIKFCREYTGNPLNENNNERKLYKVRVITYKDYLVAADDTDEANALTHQGKAYCFKEGTKTTLQIIDAGSNELTEEDLNLD